MWDYHSTIICYHSTQEYRITITQRFSLSSFENILQQMERMIECIYFELKIFIFVAKHLNYRAGCTVWRDHRAKRTTFRRTNLVSLIFSGFNSQVIGFEHQYHPFFVTFKPRCNKIQCNREKLVFRTSLCTHHCAECRTRYYSEKNWNKKYKRSFWYNKK